MHVSSIEQLDYMSGDQLWEVAADVSNDADTRHEAIQRWLYPPDQDSEVSGGTRLRELAERADVIEPDEVEEDDIEDQYREAPYFDGQGRLIVEYNGVQYLIDSDAEG